MKRYILTSVLLISCTGFLAAQEVPKADLFFGYSFLRYNSAQTIPAFTANGGVGTFGWNFNDHWALEAELGGYHNGNVNSYHFDSTSFSYLFGPRVSLGRHKTVDPYIHALFGGQNFSTSIAQSSVLVVNPLQTSKLSDGRYQTATNAFAMAIGGGLDIKLGKSITLRPVQIDYYLTRFEIPDVTLPMGGSVPTARNQNNFRYAAGIGFNFGGERPEPPPPAPRVTTRTCPDGSTVPMGQDCPKRNIGLGLNVSQRDVCAGGVVKITPAGTLPVGAITQWSVDGQPINQAVAFDFGTTGRAPGTYRIGLKVTAEGFNDASTEATVTIRGYEPPSGSVAASPAEMWVGEKAALSAHFSVGQCGGPLQPASFAVTEGSVSGAEFDSSGVAFDPSDNAEQRKTITITAKVSDSQGSGSAQAQVVVKKKAAIAAKRLPDVVFPANSTRVNNCGKRVLLEELKTYADADSTGVVVFVGHQSASESASGLDLKRALNAAAVISAGEGICTTFPASQIFLVGSGTDQSTDFQPYFCGGSANGAERVGQAIKDNDDAAKSRRVEVWFVPSGAVAPASAQGSKSAIELNVKSLGCPR